MEDKSMKGLNTFTDQTEAPKVDATRKMRIGIIGCGWIAGSHMDSYLKQPDVEIVAAADLVPGKAEAFCERYGVGENVKIFLWGVSMGGATVLMSLDLPLPKNVLGVVSDCPYTSPEAIIKLVGKKIKMPVALLFPFLRLGARLFGGFRLGEVSAEKSVLKSEKPVLLLHGAEDTFVPCEMSEKMANDARGAGVELRFLKFENATEFAKIFTFIL